MNGGKDAEANSYKHAEDDDSSADAVQRSMGYLGPWQIMVCMAISLVKFPVAWHQLGIVFMAPKNQGFKCLEPGPGLVRGDNSTDQCLAVIDKSTEVECTKWEYDRSIFTETVISQVGLKKIFLSLFYAQKCKFSSNINDYSVELSTDKI